MRNNTKQRARATEEVILSAGVVGSPHILLLSGIGPRKQLERLKVGLGRYVVVWCCAKEREQSIIIFFSPFSPFAAVSLLGVAGLAQTFPSFYLIFQAFSSFLTVSYHRNFSLPVGRFPSIFISATAQMFSVSSVLLMCPNHSSLFCLVTVEIDFTFASSKISSFLRCSNRPIAHGTILISVVAIRFSSLTDIGHVSHPLSKVGLITV